ncbi:zinc finger protein 638 [Melanotaenia boesemani]|uniref:zinc finger protein 638 n=1 Tax=Melanotaenia boesemani TaxID=1250792 RepID=UPI001C0439A6|nr:zinc finger protein 638 [Melanotaenia boesemani]
MYQQHPQQQGSQPFPNPPMPPHHQPPANQHLNRSNMQAMGFQFPRPTQLPEELESALAIRGARDMDHRQLDHMNPPNQGSGSGLGQHGVYGSNPLSLPADNQPGHQQGVDWSSYQPPTKLFAIPPPNAGHQGAQQPPQPRQSLGGRGGGDGQSLYTPESAGSILASFGLSNEDLEVLSHYPDDQLTPDTLPFILRDIQINKSGNQKSVASTSSSTFPHSIHKMPAPPSCSLGSPEVPSLLTVTQTAGKVIDYGHASRGKDESTTRETFKREPLSSERTVKMYLLPPSAAPKADQTERRQVRLEHKEPSKHEDRDYRRTGSEKRKSSLSPGREFPRLPKTQNLDKDYRHAGSKPRHSSETRSEASSRRSLSSSSGSRPLSSSKKLPTPAMISDFAAASPKAYPHTCSLCHIQCDQEKDWVDHINTVDHTAACRDLRNKYPDWKPHLPSRSGRYGSRALWDPKDGSPFQSTSQPLSRSPSPRHRMDTHRHRRAYSPHGHQRLFHYSERSHRFVHHHSSSHSPPYSHRASSSNRENWSERGTRESSGSFPRGGLKRPHDGLSKSSADSGHASSSFAAGLSSKHPPSKSVKGATKPTVRTTKTSVKPPPAKKKKKVVTPASQSSGVADRLVYLTGIPMDATEQEVTDLVGSFGKINNVILMPCSEEESEKHQGQRASVCMVKAEDAQALASSASLCIREKEITASVAKKPKDGASSDANSKPAPDQDKGVAGKGSEGEADNKAEDQKCKVLITGLPESGWSESDVAQLVQSFETPSDIILAARIGKALVSLPDLEVAEEMVKVHSFKPAKINDSEVKMTLVKQPISLSTPVALYNILMSSADPLESSGLVGWSSLLVIRNVPDTPAGSSEVLKLVRRFGTVIKTLVLSNMVICEMATAAMALSVYKRFQMFPCIIQNNPLFFSRKPDPKASTQGKVIAAYRDVSQDKPANGDDSQSAAAAEEVMAHGEKSEPPLEAVEKDCDEKMEKMAEDDIKEERMVSESPAALDADSVTEIKETSDAEEKKDAGFSEEGKDSMSAGEKTQRPPADGSSLPQEAAMPELPKMTQAMVNALLVECRTRTASHPKKTAAPAAGKTEEAQAKTEAETAEESATLEEERQDRDRKDRDFRKEKEVKERERREKERRAWEKARARREKERAEKASKERERREEERRWRERKRGYGEDLGSGSRSSCRSEGYRQSSWRDGQYGGEAESRKVEEEESDDFPFNMSDFVTVDEVGDVADLPSPTVATETSQEEHPTPGQQDAPEDTPMEVAVTQEYSDEPTSKSEDVSEPIAEVSLGFTAGLDLVPSTPVPLCQPEDPQDEVKPEPDKKPKASLESTADVEPVPVPADSSSNSPTTGVMAEDDKDSSPLLHGQRNSEEVDVSTKQEEEDKAEAEKLEKAEEYSEEKSTKTELKMDVSMDTQQPLPPYDSSKPVGLEYLVPKTGFFCRVCSRFFSGAKVAEISHCKTLKHYENLKKFLQTKAE